MSPSKTLAQTKNSSTETEPFDGFPKTGRGMNTQAAGLLFSAKGDFDLKKIHPNSEPMCCQTETCRPSKLEGSDARDSNSSKKVPLASKANGSSTAKTHCSHSSCGRKKGGSDLKEDSGQINGFRPSTIQAIAIEDSESFNSVLPFANKATHLPGNSTKMTCCSSCSSDPCGREGSDSNGSYSQKTRHIKISTCHHPPFNSHSSSGETINGEMNCSSTKKTQCPWSKPSGSEDDCYISAQVAELAKPLSENLAIQTSVEKDGCCLIETDVDTCKDGLPPKEAVDIAIKNAAEDQLSSTLGLFATTKLRVLNICCASDGELVENTLKPLDGVSSVSVNVIGRVAYVRHAPDKISAAELVNILNGIHLGVSIMESGSGGEKSRETGLPRSLKLFGLYVVVQSLVIVAALTGFFLETSWHKWMAIAEIVLGSIPILQKSFASIRICKLDISILMLIAVAGTVAIQQWIEGAIVVYVYSVAEGLEKLCMFKVQRTISGLMLQAPQMAVLAESGESVHVDEVAIGTVIAARPGDLIPLDGEVVKGQASVDESSISGEAVPVEKSIGSKVWSGTVNQNGYLEVKTTADSSTSTVSKVAEMVEEAQASSTQTEVVINRFAKYYTPLVVTVAVLMVVIPAILAASGVGTYRRHMTEWGRRALFLLVIACPCALVMATPIAVVCGITASARNGALVKGAVHLETMARLQMLGFDKTGTLTEGHFMVTDIECPPGVDEQETLSLAAAIESKTSHHPLAAAIVHKFRGCVTDMVSSKTVTLPPVSSFELHEGRGISGVVDGKHVRIGNYEFLHLVGGRLSEDMDEKYRSWSQDSKTVVFVCVDGPLAMMISLADSVRPSAIIALQRLQKLGVQTTMITGDNHQTAQTVGAQLGLHNCISQMKPQQKLSWIQSKQESETVGSKYSFRCPEGICCEACSQDPTGCIVGMVGDGINDGPALAAANVGIAMGAGGTALAVESADVALMNNNLAKIPEIIVLGRFCCTVVRQNIVLAVMFKILIVGVALAGMAKLWMAVLADMLALLCVVMNGLRPLWWESRVERKVAEVYFTKKNRFYYTKVKCSDEDEE